MLFLFVIGWLVGRKGIRPVKTEWWGAGVVVCLERGADLHMTQALTVSCFSKIHIGFTFLVPPYPVFPDEGLLNVCVCVCVCVCARARALNELTRVGACVQTLSPAVVSASAMTSP